MSSWDTFANRSKILTTTFHKKMLSHMFHRHVPKILLTHSFTSQPKATQPSRQCQDKNQCRGGHGLSTGCLLLPSSLEHYNYNRTPRNHAYCLSTQRANALALLETWKWKMVKASLLVPTGLGEGFESILEHDSKAHPPLCVHGVLRTCTSSF